MERYLNPHTDFESDIVNAIKTAEKKNALFPTKTKKRLKGVCKNEKAHTL